MHDLTDSPASYLAHAEEVAGSIELVMGEALENWLSATAVRRLQRRRWKGLPRNLKKDITIPGCEIC